MSAFRTAVETADHEAIGALLADDVIFTSPVAHTPYPGKAITAAIIRTVFDVFEDFHYVREMRTGDDEALMFTATVDGLDLTGCDFIRWDADGKIADFMVMVRPLRAAQALAQTMAGRWESIQALAADAPTV
jgi:ketosteroid isomerase-like protein